MYILSTIHEFMENPMGKGSNAIGHRKLIMDDLKHRYINLLSTKPKDFDVKILKGKRDYFFIVQVPSETERDNTYDVVVQFIVPDESPTVENEPSLKHYHIKLFSNNPAFTFTYAFAFNQYGLMADYVHDKYKNQVLDESPTTRNPSEVISYEKSTIFALMYILDSELLQKKEIDKRAKPFSKDVLLKSIRTSDKILLEIKEATSALRKKKKEEREEYDRKRGAYNKARPGVTKSVTSSTGRESSKRTITPRSTSKTKIGARPKRPKR